MLVDTLTLWSRQPLSSGARTDFPQVLLLGDGVVVVVVAGGAGVEG